MRSSTAGRPGVKLNRRRWRRVDRKVDEAGKSLAAARQARDEQEAKHAAEQRGVIAAMDELAAENHLGALVWHVLTDRDGTENGSGP